MAEDINIWEQIVGWYQWIPAPAPLLQWITLMLAVVGAMGALEMIFGRPKIEIEFDSKTGDGYKVLNCFILNKPVRNKLLRIIGASRRSTHIITTYSIRKVGSNELVVRMGRSNLNPHTGVRAERVNLAPGWPASFVIFVKNEDEENIKRLELDDEIPIGPGEYTVDVEVMTEAIKLANAKKDVTLGKELDSMYWH